MEPSQSRLASLLENLLSGGQNSAQFSPIVAGQIRYINSTLMIMFIVGIPFLLRSIYWQIPSRIVVVGSALALIPMIMLAFRHNERPQVFGHLTVALVCIAFINAIYTSGGIFGEALGWIFVPPLLAGLLVDRNALLIWLAICLLVIIELSVRHFNGSVSPSLTPEASQASQRILHIVGVIISISVIAYSYLRTVSSVNEELANSLKQLIAEVNVRKKAEHDAIEAKNDRSRFFANMSHELRTPLNSIIGYSKKIKGKVHQIDSVKAEIALDSINRNGHHLLTLVNDLLDLSSVDADKMRLNVERTDLSKIITDVITDLEPLAENSNLFLNHNISPNLFTHGDAVRLRQVFVNVIENAIKYTDIGGVTVTSLPAEHDVIRIEIKDTGIGLSPSDIERVFDEYSHIPRIIDKDIRSTGLGLALSKKLMLLQQGDIAVTSELDSGSVFTIHLKQAD